MNNPCNTVFSLLYPVLDDGLMVENVVLYAITLLLDQIVDKTYNAFEYLLLINGTTLNMSSKSRKYNKV